MLPLLLLYLVLTEVVQLVVLLATPITDLFPVGTFDKIEHPVLLALVLILVVSFVHGLALRLAILRRVGVGQIARCSLVFRPTMPSNIYHVDLWVQTTSRHTSGRPW